ncbi:MAG: hypothetical protein KatS3mg129_2236 [Leptospiraceae bacterium]|nr:MAG: hypothetical protein KatS3mg129_2236 [Leptospiraceae bacterium]
MFRLVVFLGLFLFLYCSSINEIDSNKKSDFFPEFLDYSNYLNNKIFIGIADLKEKRSDSFETQQIKDKIILQVNEVNWNIENDRDEELLNEIKESSNYLLKYIFRSISEKSPQIIFITDKSNKNINPTHLLDIRIYQDDKNPSKQIKNFKFHYTIHRIDNKQIYYDFESDGFTIQNNNENVLFITSENLLLPSKNYYIHFDKKQIDSLIKSFETIGKGKLNILSSSKNYIIVKRDSENINKNIFLYKGETPAELTLLEGKYIIEAKKKGYPAKEIQVNIKEKNHQNIFIKWDDEEITSNLNILSNKELSIFMDNELKGIAPVYVSELYEGQYHIELLESIDKESNQWKTLYASDISLQKNQILNLFYPIQFYEDFRNHFIEHINQSYWFIDKNSIPVSNKQIQEDGFLVLNKQMLFTPDIILDNLKGEIIFDCENCEILFQFSKHTLLLKKYNDLYSLYTGDKLLKLEKVFRIKEKSNYIYFDFDSKTNIFDLYINTNNIWNNPIEANYLSIGFKNLLLKEFFVSEKESKTKIGKLMYFMSKNINKTFDGNYKIR